MSGVAAFVIAHNHAATLAATLVGLTEQTRPADRVVVICNACTDPSAEVARTFAATLPLELVEWGENRGFAAAANEAIRMTAGEWVLALNPDCRLAPHYIERLLEAVAGSPRAGAATGLLMRASGPSLEPTEVVDSGGMIVTASGRHLDRDAGKPLRSGLLRPSWVFGASGAAALYRRRAIEDVAYPGGEVFDEGFFAYREDADLAWRLQRRGWSCLYWPAARAAHARGLKPEADRRATPEINRHSVRNRFLLRWSNADWRWRVACFPFWTLRDLTVVAACLSIERTSASGLVEAWRMRRRQLARGRANAARATVSGWDVARWFRPGGRVREVVAT